MASGRKAAMARHRGDQGAPEVPFHAPQFGLHGEPRPQAAAASSIAAPRRMKTDELFPEGVREIQIDHAGEVYRLTLTRYGKLILNK